MKTIKLRKFMNHKLKFQYAQGKGKSRRAIKDDHNHSPMIHSEESFKTYMKQCMLFCDWCTEHGINSPEGGWDAIPVYLQEKLEKGCSAYTLKTIGCALAKPYDKRMVDIDFAFPKKERSQIKRSRTEAVRDKGFSDKTPEGAFQKALGQGFGLRKNKELAQITWNQLVRIDGKLCLKDVLGKGGKKRNVPFHGTPEQEKLIGMRYMTTEDKSTKICPNPLSHMDEHAFRADYAATIYQKYARPLDQIPKEDLYVCRADKSGQKYDKKALAIVSKYLGHNRLNVVVNNYSHKFIQK